MRGFLKNNDALSGFSNEEINFTFDHCCSKLEQDYNIGKAELLVMVCKAKKYEEASLIPVLCISIASADGDFDDNEKKMVDEIKEALN